MKRVFDWVLIFFGAFIFALGFNIFLKPASVAPGGITGISLLLNFLMPKLPVGVLTLLLNIPLFVLGFYKLGGEFLRRTVITTTLLSILLDAPLNFMNFKFEPLLSAIFGGVFIGCGMGLAFLPNSSTGGMDIIIRVLRQKFPQFSMGQLMLSLDALIVIAAGFVFGNISNSLYAIISMYVASITLDAILYGLNFAKAAFIVTNKSYDIKQKIHEDLCRGTTVIPCLGGYSNMEKSVVLCAVKRNELGALKKTVSSIDPEAFVILTEAHEVHGLGFKSRI